MRPGVRQLELIGFHPQAAEADQIQIEWSGLIELALGNSTVFTLQGLEPLEELIRIGALWQVEAHDRVEKLGGPGWTIHRGGFPHGGDLDRRRTYRHQLCNDLAEDPSRITEIRA
jgi:hypothetical protein